jgi:Transposase DDE domain
LGTFGGSKSGRILPASLAAFRVLAFDGKKLKHVARLLKPLRGLKGKICGGKLLVAQDVATQQAVAVEAHPDGEAGEAPMVPGVVARIRAGVDSRPRLWIADRAFCDSKTLPQLAEEGDAFAIRHIASYKFHPDPEGKTRAGTDSEGRSYVEQWGHLGSGSRRVPVRKITVTRPGEQPFALVTSLTDAAVYPADDLLALYRLRWGIETMFQKVVQTFELRHLIGGSPEATVFQAVLCLLLYNVTLVVRNAVAEDAGRDRNTVSLELLFDDLRRQMTGLLQMVEPSAVAEALAAVPVIGPEALRKHLRSILGGVWTNRWTKAPTRTGQPAKRTNRAYLGGGHSSVHKIQQGKHVEIPLETGPLDQRTKKDKRPYETKNDDV